jgi:hypothetical protein
VRHRQRKTERQTETDRKSIDTQRHKKTDRQRVGMEIEGGRDTEDKAYEQLTTKKINNGWTFLKYF